MHSPGGDPSWGQNIIDSYSQEQVLQQKLSNERRERTSKHRAALRLELESITEDTNPEASRLLVYLEGVLAEDVEVQRDSAERLQQAVHLAADILPEVSTDMILSLAQDAEFSELMLPIYRVLTSMRPDLSDRLADMALMNIEQGLSVESSAAVLTSLGEAITYPLDESYIDVLIHFANRFDLTYELSVEEPDFRQSTELLIRSLDAQSESVLGPIRHGLESNDQVTRFRVCGVVRLIQRERPSFGLNLTRDLIQSLQLHERSRRSPSPSGQIVQILRSAYCHSPEQID